MKLSILIFLVIASVFLLSCDKDPKNPASGIIIGTWISADKSDTLHFVDRESFYKSDINMTYDHYDYELLNDSIKIGYSGSRYILVVPSSHFYKLSGEELTIDFTNKLCYGFGLERVDYYKFK
ncbi:MAG: hypothetical protein WC951_06850 [Bacteroidales bacterium]